VWRQASLPAGLRRGRAIPCPTQAPSIRTQAEESQREIDLAPETIAVLRLFKKGSTSESVLDDAQPNPAATYDYYRCDCFWRDLNGGCTAKVCASKKAIHSLHKESGSLIASTHGIEAARQHLGHRDIRPMSSHYVDKKKRVEVKLPIGGMTGKFTGWSR